MLLLLISLMQAPVAEAPDAAQALRLVKGLHEGIRDFSFVYEGNMECVGPERIVGKETKERDLWKHHFQGELSYREEDGAALVNFYQINAAPGSVVSQTKWSFLKGAAQERILVPDKGIRNPKPVTTGATQEALNQPDSPYRFFFHWYFHGLSEADASRVEGRGWEVVDGHKCLVVDIIKIPGEQGVKDRFWIDLDRGGNPLRYEEIGGASTVRCRTHDIRLTKLKAGEKEVWLPISGTQDSFLWNSSYHADPIYRANFSVVNGSIRINTGLSNGDFSVMKPDSADPKAKELKLSGQYRDAMSRPPPDPVKTDPKSVRERIDAHLAEADRQAKMLEASAPSRESWSWVGAVQVTVAVAAVALIGTALMMRRRSS